MNIRLNEVVTLGEPMAVLYPREQISLRDASSVLLDIAGAESNTAIGLSRLGHRAALISRVGSDSLGERVISVLTSEGVDTRYIQVDRRGPTGVLFRECLPDGLRRVFYYRAGSAASYLSPEDLNEAAFSGARIVHLTGITPALSASCAAAVEEAIKLAHAKGALVSFDPNYRAPLWDTMTARKVLQPLMEQADILLMGHDDVNAILGVSDAQWQSLARAFPARIIVLKRAEQGASAFVDGKRIDVASYPVETVVDPVGAGDAFNAGFLAGYLRGYTAEDALQLGARLGAAAVASLGDYGGLRDIPELDQRPS